jgi:hypothetical protein
MDFTVPKYLELIMVYFEKACQGDRLDAGTTMLPRVTETDSPSAVAYKIPTHADFLIAYSTVPGKNDVVKNVPNLLPMTYSIAILWAPRLPF